MAQKRTAKNLVDTDPRTGLDLAAVPEEFCASTPQLRHKVIYWIGFVDKINRAWDKNRRILVVSDRHIYLLNPRDRAVKRSIDMKKVQECIHDTSQPNKVALRLKGTGDVDLLFEVSNRQEKSDIIRIIGKVLSEMLHETLAERHLAKGEKLEAVMRRAKNKGVSTEKANLTLTSQSVLVQLQQRTAAEAAARAEEPDDGAQEVLYNYEGETPDDDAQELRRPSYADESRDLASRSDLRDKLANLREGLANSLKDYRNSEIEEAQDEMAGYVAMIAERDHEIDTLRKNYLSLKENPEFWKSCLRCKQAQQEITSAADPPDKARKKALQKKLADLQDLINHMQASRASGGTTVTAIESQEIAALRKRIEESEDKVKILQRLIIDNPYPTEDTRIKADQVARGLNAPAADNTERARELHATIAELQKQHTLKEKELKHSKLILRDAFRRQVEELGSVRHQFQLYDEHIVDYLEKVFSGNAFPQGIEAYGQTPLQLAKATSQAARQAATPPAFPHATASVHMPLSPQREMADLPKGALSRQSLGTIGQYVPPNVISTPDRSASFANSPARPYQSHSVHPASLDAMTPLAATVLTGMGRGSGSRRSLL